MATWKIDGGSITDKTLEELNISNAKITFRNRAADEARMVIDGDYADNQFSHGETYAIKKDSTVVFRGRCEKIGRLGSGSSRSVEVTLLGGWHWLTLYMFQQSWPKGASGSGNKSRVILGCDSSGALVSANAQINAILGCCAEVSAGTLSVSSSSFPMDEKVDITCAEAINAVLAWWPDAIVWFDYSTGTRLNIKRVADLSTASVNLSDAAEEVQATARRDLQVPGVRLIYETTSGAYRSVTLDEAPDSTAANGPGGLIHTISVAGAAHDIASVKITSAPLPDTLSPAWWAGRIPELAGWTDVTLGANPTVTLSDGTIVSPHSIPGGGTTWKPVVGTKTLHSELLSGSVADWMHEAVDRVRVTQTASYTLNDQSVEEVLLSIDLTLTSAETGIYQHGSSTRPETIPTGLAAEIYAAVGRLYHEGTVTLVGEEPPSSVGLGDNLHLVGGPSAWSSMNAPVQSVAWDLATGSARISFGPPNHLGVQDLVARARANRLRGPAHSLFSRLSSSTADDGIPVGGATGSVNSSAGGGFPSKITAKESSSAPNKIEIDATTLADPNHPEPTIKMSCFQGEAKQSPTFLLMSGSDREALLCITPPSGSASTNCPKLCLADENGNAIKLIFHPEGPAIDSGAHLVLSNSGSSALYISPTGIQFKSGTSISTGYTGIVSVGTATLTFVSGMLTDVSYS